MSLAREINKELDNILKIKAEIKKADAEITDDEILTNVHTGEKVGKKEVIETAHNMRIKSQENLMELIGDGSNIKDIFTNKFYVNDFVQDKICAEEQIEETLNKGKPNNIQDN